MGGGESRSAYEDRYHQQFERDLKGIDPVDRGRIIAKLEAFMADWTNDAPVAELQSRWKYKKVGERVKGQAVMQIRVVGNYRVTLLPVAGTDPVIWFLQVCRRQTTNQEEIERAEARAKNILEQDQP